MGEIIVSKEEPQFEIFPKNDRPKGCQNEICPVNGELLLDNIPRLFPRWMIDFFSRRGNFDVLGNQASDMEVISVKLMFDVKGYDECWESYGDLALFFPDTGWEQYYIDVDQFRTDGTLVFRRGTIGKVHRDILQPNEAQLVFQKTKFGTWINFPWYLASPGLNHGLNPFVLSSMYVKASSAKFEVSQKATNTFGS